MASKELSTKGAIVTGGGSGINLAFVKALWARGCSVLIGDLGLHNDAKQWLQSIDQDSGPKIIFQHADVTMWDHLDRLFDVYARKFGGVPDIVVAGAGIYEASSPSFWDERDKGSHYKLLDINLVHPIRLTRIAIKRLRRAGKSGVIIHESSIVAQKPSPVLPLYAISKAGLSHLVRSMAPLDKMSGIRVVAVAPGIVDTPLFRDNENALDHIDTETDYLLPPEEVVKAMLALVKDNTYGGGTILEVNGVDSWREVTLLNDRGTQGASKPPRRKAAEMIKLVEAALETDRQGGKQSSKL